MNILNKSDWKLANNGDLVVIENISFVKEDNLFIPINKNGESIKQLENQLVKLEDSIHYQYNSDETKRIKSEIRKIKTKINKFEYPIILSEQYLFFDNPLILGEKFKSNVMIPTDKNGDNIICNIKLENGIIHINGSYNNGEEYTNSSEDQDFLMDILEKDIWKLEKDQTSYYVFQEKYGKNDNKSYKVTPFEKFKNNRGYNSLNSDELELLERIFSRYQHKVWEKLTKSDIRNIQEKVLDSRFENAKPNYVGRFSGDCIVKSLLTVEIEGIKYHKLSSENISTRGFF